MILFHTQFSEFFRALLFSRILAIPSCFRITAMCRGVFPSCPIKSRTFIGTLSLLTCYLINFLGVSIKMISILSFDLKKWTHTLSKSFPCILWNKHIFIWKPWSLIQQINPITSKICIAFISKRTVFLFPASLIIRFGYTWTSLVIFWIAWFPRPLDMQAQSCTLNQ